MTVVTDAFAPLARAVATSLDLPDLPLMVLPSDLSYTTNDAVRRACDERWDSVVAGLVDGSPLGGGSEASLADGPASARAEHVAAPADPLEFFAFAEEQGWTDGLPVIAPAEDLVAGMLAATRRDPGESLGLMGPSGAPATIEKLAVNAVMAGCLPAYFTTVIAAVEAMCDPAYELLAPQVTTNAVAPLLIVNGPVRQRLGLNSGGGCLGPGWRANATIGRAISLVLRNVGGARPPEGSRSTHGQPARYSFCVAEDEEHSPWEPLHVERGLVPDTSAVTVVAVSGNVDCVTANDDDGEVCRIIGSTLGAWGNIGMIYSGGLFVSSSVILSPGRAALFAGSGHGKADVKEAIWAASSARAEEMPYRHRVRNPMPNVIDGRVYPAKRPEDLVVVVAGADEPYHATALPGFVRSPPVTRAIEEEAS